MDGIGRAPLRLDFPATLAVWWTLDYSAEKIEHLILERKIALAVGR